MTTNKQQRTTNHRLLHDLQRLLRRPRDDRFVTNFDDRSLQQRRIVDDRLDDISRRRIRVQPEFLRLCLALAKYFERRDAELSYQVPERFLSERFVKIIDPLCVDAVFTKQRSQIPARGSGRLFVDGDFVFCHF